MRKIRLSQILVFLTLFFFAVLLAIITAKAFLNRIPLGDFRSIILLSAGIVFVYIYAIVIYRLFLLVLPFGEGEIMEGSREEFSYHVYLLFHLLLFYPITRSGLAPLPLMRILYLALGARLGRNTYSSGIIFDPHFVEIGDNTLIGQYALLMPHVIERNTLSHKRIRIGSNVTIGAHAVVMSGVIIEDNAIVATGAVVLKGTHILKGEVWGGVPSRKIKDTEDKDGQ